MSGLNHRATPPRGTAAEAERTGQEPERRSVLDDPYASDQG